MTPPAYPKMTALFGGTFDPPHLGHRQAVEGLFRNPGVTRVVVIPSATPPQKPAQTAAQHRFKMAELCFENIPGLPQGAVEVSRCEITRAERSPGQPSYSFETIEELKAQLTDVAFVVGADQLENLPTWHRFPEILGLCHWIILARKPNGAQIAGAVLQKWEGLGLVRTALGGWVTGGATGARAKNLIVVPTDAPELSSRNIRETMNKTGSLPENSLLPAVAQYLKQNRLYGIFEDKKTYA